MQAEVAMAGHDSSNNWGGSQE